MSTYHEALTICRRLFIPQWKSYLSLLMSMTLGVCALLTIQGVINSAQLSISKTSRDLLGADMVISSWRPLDDDWSAHTRQELAERGRLADVTELATMTQVTLGRIHTQPPRLSALKVVSDLYPLRGQLSIQKINVEGNLAPGRSMSGKELPDDGVWVAKSLWESQLKPALDSIKQRPSQVLSETPLSLLIGGIHFRVAGVIELESDGGFAGALSFAPRVMINEARLDSLGLIRPGSRVKHKILFANSTSDTREASPQGFPHLLQKIKEGSPDHIQVQDFASGQQNIATLIERVGLFFSMVALVTLVLSLFAFSAGVWGVIHDHLPHIATARSLGVRGKVIKSSYTALILSLGLLGGLLGLLISQGLTSLITPLLTEITGVRVDTYFEPSSAIEAISIALLMGLIVNIIAQRGLGRLNAQALWSGRLHGLKVSLLEWIMFILFTGLLVTQYLYYRSGSLSLALGFAIALLLLGVGFLCLSSLLTTLIAVGLKLMSGYRWPPSLLFSLKQLLGHRHRLKITLFSLGLSFSFMGGLELISASLVSAMRVDDESAPHVFLIDIQEDQKQLIAKGFESIGLQPPPLRPLIRARISAINGETVSAKQMSDESPATRLRRRSLTREFNLTTQIALSDTETLTSGQWWSPEEAQSSTSNSLSVETRFAQRIGLELGDELTFDIQGRELTFKVSSLRSVNWLSFAPNFIFILPPGPLSGAPLTYISASKLSKDVQFEALSRSLYQSATNVSLIDLRPILNEGRALIMTLSSALRWTSLVSVIAGLLLLIHILRRDYIRRRASVELLSALGVGQNRAWRWVNLELVILGLCAALTVTCGVYSTAWLGCTALNIPKGYSWSAFAPWALTAALLPPLVSSSSTMTKWLRLSK